MEGARTMLAAAAVPPLPPAWRDAGCAVLGALDCGPQTGLLHWFFNSGNLLQAHLRYKVK